MKNDESIAEGGKIQKKTMFSWYFRFEGEICELSKALKSHLTTLSDDVAKEQFQGASSSIVCESSFLSTKNILVLARGSQGLLDNEARVLVIDIASRG